MTDMTDTTVLSEDGELEVLQAETVLRTRRALLLEAKADELKAYYKLALGLSQTTMVADCYQWDGDTADKRAVHNLAGAMMFAAKLGIAPEDAGREILSIKGTPALKAMRMVGIIRAWCDKRVAQGRTTIYAEGGDWVWEVESDEKHAVWAGRRDGDEKSCEWTMERAERAEYTDDLTLRNGRGVIKSKYKTIPVEMLRARAQSEISRLLFSDVIGGMAYSLEELEMEQLVEQRAVRPVVVQPGKGMAALGAAVSQDRPENHPDHHRAGLTATGATEAAQPATPASPQTGGSGDLGDDPDGDAEGYDGGWAEREADEAQGHDYSSPDPDPGDDPDEQEARTAKPGQAQGTAMAEADQRRAVRDGDAGPDPKALTVLHTVLTEAGFGHRSQKLAVLDRLLPPGRTIESSKELTDEELGRINHQLKVWKRDGDLPAQLRNLLSGGAVADAVQAPAARATTKELQALRRAYKTHLKITGEDMLPHLSGVLGWNVTDINALSGDDVYEAIKVAEGNADRG